MRGKTAVGTVLVTGGIAAVAVALIYAFKKSNETVDNIQKAVAGGTPPEPGQKYPTVNLRLTHYYPWDARTDAEKKMEGAPVDRKKNPLHTVQDYLSGKSDHVSLAGDYTVWPYGQKLLVPWGDKTLVGRVTDTGGHFHGSGKVYRAVGYEPVDVCVATRNDAPPETKVTAQIVPKDNLEGGKAIATSGIKDQQVVVGDFADIIDPLDALSAA